MEKDKSDMQFITIGDMISNFSETFTKSEAFQNFEKTKNYIRNAMSELINNVDWQRVRRAYQFNIKILNEILRQLKEKNLDYILKNIDTSQAIELYILSYECGLTFADMVEDNLKLFETFEYEKAIKYLSTLNKRKKQITSNNLKPLNAGYELLNDIKYSDENIRPFIICTLEDYEKGKIPLNNEEKILLRHLKQNGYLKNKQLASLMNYRERGIEEICKKIRIKFNLDYVEDRKIKRHLLIMLAKYIEIE